MSPGRNALIGFVFCAGCVLSLTGFAADSRQSPRRIVIATNDTERMRWLNEGLDSSTVQLVGAGNVHELRAALVGADALLGPCSAAAMEGATTLQWVQISGVGVEECMSVPAIHSGRILLTNVQGQNAATVAEHAMALLLSLSRQLVSMSADQRTGFWNGLPPADLIELRGRTLLLVGFGNVGREIASRAHAFQMRVIAIHRTPGAKPAHVERVGSLADLERFSRDADVILNCLPLTDATRGLFDAKFFSWVKPGSLFVNVGRGQTVATDALVAALQSGALAGAALDVVDPEPLPADHVLWTLPNVVITPHVADHSDRKDERAWGLMRENLRRYVRGEQLLSVVDPKQGY